VDDSALPVWETTPDETLALKASHDRQAFAELYRRYVDPIYRYMRYQVPESEAHDLTAQVFFHAYRACDQFRGESPYKAWLFRIARNTMLTWRRSRDRIPVPVPDLPDIPDGGPDTGELVAAAQRHRELWEVVQTLSPAERELLTLRFVEDLQPKEIAQVTGHSAGTIRVRIHRVLRRLRRRLQERGIGP